MLNSKFETKKNEMELYFKYYHLDTSDLAKLLWKIDKFYKQILSDTSLPTKVEYEDIEFMNFLEIDSINTGQSIKIKFKEGWKPQFNIIDKDLEIEIPIKLGIPAIIVYFLFVCVEKSMNIYNTQLDIMLKKQELVIKNTELYEEIFNKGDRRYRQYVDLAQDTVDFLLDNEDINYLQINGLNVKDNTAQEVRATLDF
jgi:hypothetical protein